MEGVSPEGCLHSCIQGQHPLGRVFKGGTPLPMRGVGGDTPDGSF
jgi:hypothetical protein